VFDSYIAVEASCVQVFKYIQRGDKIHHVKFMPKPFHYNETSLCHCACCILPVFSQVYVHIILYLLYKDLDIVRVIKVARITWLGHLSQNGGEFTLQKDNLLPA
jgi:hypothetical protein